MYDNRYYLKPNMTNLPAKLGRAVFNEILNSPKPDMEELRKKADEIRNRIREAKENGTF